MLCHKISSSIPGTTYCNITETWQPRFSDTTLYIMTVIPAVISVLILLPTLPFLARRLHRYNKTLVDKEQVILARRLHLHRNNKTLVEEQQVSEHEEVDMFVSLPQESTSLSSPRDEIRCCTCFCCSCCCVMYKAVRSLICFMSEKVPFLTFVIFPMATLTWDTVDVGLDLYCFNQLEKGHLIDGMIFRNHYVNNGIYAFALLGCIKLLLCVCFFYSIPNEEERDSIKVPKLLNYCVVYLLEDAGEMFLEYFYIEKYFTEQPTPFLFIRDVILFLMASYTIVDVLRFAHDEMKWNIDDDDVSSRVFLIMLTLCSVCVGTSNLLRVAGAGYQYTTSKLHPNCLGVVGGRLQQFPFAGGCLREIDYIILPLIFVPVLIGIFYRISQVA